MMSEQDLASIQCECFLPFFFLRRELGKMHTRLGRRFGPGRARPLEANLKPVCRQRANRIAASSMTEEGRNRVRGVFSHKLIIIYFESLPFFCLIAASIVLQNQISQASKTMLSRYFLAALLSSSLVRGWEYEWPSEWDGKWADESTQQGLGDGCKINHLTAFEMSKTKDPVFFSTGGADNFVAPKILPLNGTGGEQVCFNSHTLSYFDQCFSFFLEPLPLVAAVRDTSPPPLPSLFSFLKQTNLITFTTVGIRRDLRRRQARFRLRLLPRSQLRNPRLRQLARQCRDGLPERNPLCPGRLPVFVNHRRMPLGYQGYMGAQGLLVRV
jgi:hypothetical protein